MPLATFFPSLSQVMLSRILVALLALHSLPVLSISRKSSCAIVTIPVYVERNKGDFQLTDAYDVNVLYALAQKEILTTNSYNLSAKICVPKAEKNLPTPSDTIQLLVHGATFNKVMWDFPYRSETYSWTKKMNEAGYPTIAVDLVGE